MMHMMKNVIESKRTDSYTHFQMLVKRKKIIEEFKKEIYREQH